MRRGSRVLCLRGGFLCNIFVCFSLFLWFAVAMVLFPLHLSFLFFYFCLSFIFFPHCFRFAFILFLAFSASQLPSPHPCHWVQCRAVLCPVAPPLLWQGDVRVASFDVTSGPTSQQLSAPRLALSGAFFHCLSLIPFPLYPPLIAYFFFHLSLSLYTPLIWSLFFIFHVLQIHFFIVPFHYFASLRFML